MQCFIGDMLIHLTPLNPTFVCMSVRPSVRPPKPPQKQKEAPLRETETVNGLCNIFLKCTILSYSDYYCAWLRGAQEHIDVTHKILL